MFLCWSTLCCEDYISWAAVLNWAQIKLSMNRGFFKAMEFSMYYCNSDYVILNVFQSI